jgi:hypothetical protein
MRLDGVLDWKSLQSFTESDCSPRLCHLSVVVEAPSKRLGERQRLGVCHVS